MHFLQFWSDHPQMNDKQESLWPQLLFLKERNFKQTKEMVSLCKQIKPPQKRFVNKQFHLLSSVSVHHYLKIKVVLGYKFQQIITLYMQQVTNHRLRSRQHKHPFKIINMQRFKIMRNCHEPKIIYQVVGSPRKLLLF